jgi:hypothetical protein
LEEDLGLRVLVLICVDNITPAQEDPAGHTRN